MVKQSNNSECLISDIINLIIINGLNTHSYSYDELSRGRITDVRLRSRCPDTPVLVQSSYASIAHIPLPESKNTLPRRQEQWHFLCHDDETAIFWQLYLGAFSPNCDPVTRSDVVRQMGRMRIDWFCARKGIDPRRLWARAIRRRVIA